MERYLNAIREAGFTTWSHATSAHVQLPDGHQIAVFRIDIVERFEWGWVETAGGREDTKDWARFWRLLGTHAVRES